ncbi:Chorismate mutase I / Prephenate dehydratase [gamma proteobacterium IMCC2047]|nr:Chorismate mutase I / Prephenate dehydratase [gamma proteobacterium IMCC2047]
MTDAKDSLPDLGQLRDDIDRIDNEIQQLINQRARCAQQVAEVKTAAEGSENVLFYRPEREAQVLRSVMARNEGPVDDEEMARIFRELMSVCLALEHPMKIAFLGPEGTFTQAAALKHFGHSVSSVPMASIDEVFREVESGAANYGVVPVENSTEGMVNSTLDSFMRSSLKICGEVELRIHQNLLVKEAVPADQITRIYSHEQSLAQCRQWLNANLPKAERISVSSNAEAARMVAEGVGSEGGVVAAIAGDMAAELYQLVRLTEKLEDQPDNTTRFLIIGNQDVPASGADKTSIIAATRNKPGALYHLLEPFQRENISLTRVETRPSESGTWTYVFFMDFEGHCDDKKVRKVLKEIADETVELKLLGSYPKAVL